MHNIIYKIKSNLEREVQSLRNNLVRKTELLAELRNYCRKECSHQWVTDYIDIDPEKSEKIMYCKKCELSLK